MTLLPLGLWAQAGDDARLDLLTETPPYDGRFTFTRIRYDGPGFRGWGRSTWSHDYPEADRDFFPLDVTNEAYALGVNSLVYGLTY